jgi:hypothetical protein
VSDPAAGYRLLRRSCVYCADPPTTAEHIFQEAIGGKLTARILCAAHNAFFSDVDRDLADHYAVLVWASGTVRDRGGRERWPFGTRLRFPDAKNQRATIINPDGSNAFDKVTVELNEVGKPVRFDGPLDSLRAIAAKNGNGPIVEIVSPGPTIPVGVGITDVALPGLMKNALHFAAGFVAEPSPATIAAVLPYMRGERRVPVVPLPFRAPWFPPGPPRHEITVYPNGRNAVVTILLFGAIAVALELPHFIIGRAVRHVQLLDGSAPRVFDVDAVPVPRRPLSDREADHYLETVMAALTIIFRARHLFDINDLAQESAREALGDGARIGGNAAFLTYFHAALQRRALPADEIKGLVREAAAALRRGDVPCNLAPLLIK